MRRTVALAVALLTGALVSGCAALTGATPGVTTSASAKAVSTATAAPAKVIMVTTPAARTGAPGLATTGTSWMAIVKSLSAYAQWLLANPNPSLVGNVATPGCAMANLLSRQMSGMLGSQTHLVPVAPAFTQVVAPTTSAATTMVLSVVASRAAETVVSDKGNATVATWVAYPVSTLQVTLDQGTDKHWRFCDIQVPGAVDDLTVSLV